MILEDSRYSRATAPDALRGTHSTTGPAAMEHDIVVQRPGVKGSTQTAFRCPGTKERHALGTAVLSTVRPGGTLGPGDHRQRVADLDIVARGSIFESSRPNRDAAPSNSRRGLL